MRRVKAKAIRKAVISADLVGNRPYRMAKRAIAGGLPRWFSGVRATKVIKEIVQRYFQEHTHKKRKG